MPTYEYECKKCSHSFETFQSMSDEPLKHCPKCGKEVRRLIFGGAGIIFKGSGFYVTDKSKEKSGTGSKPAKTPSGEAAQNISEGDKVPKGDTGSKGGDNSKGDDSSKRNAGSKRDTGSRGDDGSKKAGARPA